MLSSDYLFKVIFIKDDSVCVLYAKYVCEESIMGFVELESLMFPTENSNEVADTIQSSLKQEFQGVKRTYIPLHSIIRIDEVKVCLRKFHGIGSNVTSASSVSYIGKDLQKQTVKGSNNNSNNNNDNDDGNKS